MSERALLNPVPPTVFFRTLDSTNAEAVRRLQGGMRSPAWLVTDVQTAGRGRRGRHWVSPLGNVYASVIVPSPPLPAGQGAFVAALAVYETVASFVSPERLRLKWPNDLLLDGAKLAGILLEGWQEGEERALVCGMGINILSPPPGPEFAAVGLETVMAVTPDRDVVLAALQTAFAHWLGVWEREGFAPVREVWLTRARPWPTRLAARLPTQTLTGTWEGLDATGALLLRLDEGSLYTVCAGDIFELDGENAASH